MAKKQTIAEKFAEVETVLRANGKDELADFIAERADMATRKNGNRKPTERQLENAELLKDIEQFLRDNSPNGYTPTEMAKLIPSCAGLNPQRLAPILNKATTISKRTDKGHTLFFIG